MTRKELTVDIKKRVAAGESKRAIFSRYSMTEWEDAASRILPLRSFAYSPAGDLLATHTYTNSTDILTETYTDGTTITYTYTPDNLPLRTTYASGKWTENVYDNQRRLVGTISSDSLNNATYALDEFGRTTSSANSVASIAYSISDTDKATNEFWTVGTNTLAITRSFGSQDRLANLALPSVGYALNYTYATDGRLAAVSNNDAVITYAYTPDHLDAGYSLTLSNGAVFTRSLLRDEYRRSLVTGISSAANGVGVGSLAYTYDALNRPTTRNNDTFGYNARSEVTAANVSGVFSAYGYDEIGNSTNWAVTCLNQYTEFTHDADGNMTQCGDWTYTYDAANRLKTVPSNGVLLATNLYDAKSRRVKKVTPEATTTFFYDGWNLVEERIAYTNGTSSTIHYFWGKDLSGTLQGAGGVGGLLYLTIDGVPFIPCYDNIGNIIRYLDANGNTVAQYIYDAFGNLISKSGPLADFFRLRFSTKYFDVETGLYYYDYRFYRPTLMVWLTRDPIEERGGVNLYGFCGNNPVSRYDADGRAVRIEKNGRVITVTVNITIYYAHRLESNARTDLARIARRIKKQIEERWNAQTWRYGCCTVKFKANVNYRNQVGKSGIVDDNLIAISTDPNLRSVVYGVGGNTGYWNADNRQGSDWQYAHEAGHLMGLGDDYTDAQGPNQGHDGHMMAEDKGIVVQHEVDDIMRANNIRCD